MFKNFVAIVLAAGKGTRINAKKINKVMYPLAGKPMIDYTIDLLSKVGFIKIIIVVGFKKQAIIKHLGKGFIYAYQKKRLGTADACRVGLSKAPKGTKDVLVINADDSAFYPHRVIKNMVLKHIREKCDLTFLTVEMKNPNIARVIKDGRGKILGVVEQQNLKPGQNEFKEINCGCYCFSTNLLKKFLPQVSKNSVSQEYYITELIDMGIRNKQKVKAFKMGKEDYWYGVNTKQQLEKAEEIMDKDEKK
ncbi:MAG TPA: sugar phosphate nucleotidyltransferase [Candidatus Bathyarchaeia archaeon]|nr:sugar phosphate nucleotidyltransferase [Candidatus Bathyarchaeia archaeon]